MNCVFLQDKKLIYSYNIKIIVQFNKYLYFYAMNNVILLEVKKNSPLSRKKLDTEHIV